MTDHTHTQDSPTTTYTTAPQPDPVPSNVKESFMYKFLTIQKMNLDKFKGGPKQANTRFRNVVMEINMALIKCNEVSKEHLTPLNQVITPLDIDAWVSVTRRKLHQGRQWSKGFVDSLMQDFNKQLELEAKQKALNTTPLSNVTTEEPVIDAN